MPTSLGEPHPGGGAFLDVRDLSAGYGGAPVVHDVALTAEGGKIVSVIGPNGAGKSTLLKALTGRLKPLGGRVLLDGKDVTGAPGYELARSGLGYVPQGGDVFPTLTVRENLEMGGFLLPRRAVAGRIEEVTATLPILQPLLARHAKALSGGERKLLGIGRCLMLRPAVLILDEPTANLAPAMASRILHEYVVSLARSGTAVLLVEQRARDAMEICDWCHVMVAGRVTVSAPPGPLLARPDFGALYLGSARSLRAEARMPPGDKRMPPGGEGTPRGESESALSGGEA